MIGGCILFLIRLVVVDRILLDLVSERGTVPFSTCFIGKQVCVSFYADEFLSLQNQDMKQGLYYCFW